MSSFQPWYIFPNEYRQFGLPSASDQPDIDNLVQLASTMIDQHCMRADGDGNGSLVFTTYRHRRLLQSPGRNLLTVPFRPLVAIDTATMSALQSLDSASGGYYYTGFTPNTVSGAFQGSLTSIIAASGRYAYGRRDMSTAYPDLNALINPQNMVTLFGGPAPWVAVDITQIDYNAKSCEMWIPAGLQLQRYTEVDITYNSGFDPRDMPKAIKFACAAIVKNAMSKGGGTTGLTSFSLAKSGISMVMTPELIDPNIDRMLDTFKTLQAY